MAEPPAEEVPATDPPTRRARWHGHRKWALPAGALAVVAACVAGALAATADSGPQGSGDGDGAPVIDISLGACGRSWHVPGPGTRTFEVHNAADRAAEVHLVDAASGAVHAELEDLGPGTTRSLRAALPAGTYRFRCLPEDAAAVLGPAVRIGTGSEDGKGSGTGGGVRGVVAVDQHDLIPPTLAYQKWIGGQMPVLDKAVGALRSAVDDGDLGAARTAWLDAHLVYERMGAAYGTFGDADGAINGTDAGLPDGVHDAGFTGFHRLESGLWHGASAESLRPVADRLAKDVGALRTSWAQARMDPLDMGLRAHEILENTLQFELTGRTDFGSGTNLATARANLRGTEEALDRLRPLLRTRYPQLPALDASLEHLTDLLDAQHSGSGSGGRWTPLDELTRTERQKINAAAGDALERLADIAAICDVRRKA